MRWPWSNDRRLEQARREHQEVCQQTPKIDALARELKKHKERNHFADRFRAALGGGDNA